MTDAENRVPTRNYHEAIKEAMRLATEFGFSIPEQAKLLGYGEDDSCDTAVYLESHLLKMRSGDVRARCDHWMDVAQLLELLGEGKTEAMRAILDAKYDGLRGRSTRELLLSMNADDANLCVAFLKEQTGL